MDGEPMDITTPEQRRETISLCAALRQSEGHLGMSPANEADLGAQLAAVETLLAGERVAAVHVIDAVKALRYLLMETGDGDLAAILADSAASIVGDGYGKIFS